MPHVTASRRLWRHGATFDLVTLEGPAEILAILRNEAGGHRWQRVPPTERKGRMQTSTVTVAVMEGEKYAPLQLNVNDIQERVTKGTGPGGQNRNKRLTAIILKDRLTGIEVKAEAERTLEANRRVAMATLRERVLAYYAERAAQAENSFRKSQVGTGARGDKIRTYRADGVTDHRTGKRAALSSVEAGKLDLLL
ncbi:peptide chain release factor 1 [Novimethylophilus kurashikiensis]|uniref:Peptide chain release factor 1 n=1 Tax=Novimethylophilus kurashikiensis TaxID=1825523 RepID=A0A2R5F7Z4_9PROT|nr:peptide chain release factor-like protein [Novimethylophilus kurashikiensis]GBG14317.1 peptide chain release factor 1 [Novimethylophilus kurashikiensis]